MASTIDIRARLHEAKSVVVLTGAGISAESGIKTFRASDGLWEEHRIEDVATPEAFLRNPTLVQRFYNMRRTHLLQAHIQPNKAHLALAQFEQQFSGDFLLVTQNIDDLHDRAGSTNLIHMHGELLKMRCTVSQKIFDIRDEIHADTRCACCAKTGTLRPHIVWFHEMPLEMERIYEALSQCEVFVSIGTSGNVYPAAGFVEMANQSGALSIELNLDPSNTRSAFAIAEQGKATDLVPRFFA